MVCWKVKSSMVFYILQGLLKRFWWNLNTMNNQRSKPQVYKDKAPKHPTVLRLIQSSSLVIVDAVPLGSAKPHALCGLKQKVTVAGPSICVLLYKQYTRTLQDLSIVKQQFQGVCDSRSKEDHGTKRRHPPKPPILFPFDFEPNKKEKPGIPRVRRPKPPDKVMTPEWLGDSLGISETPTSQWHLVGPKLYYPLYIQRAHELQKWTAIMEVLFIIIASIMLAT